MKTRYARAWFLGALVHVAALLVTGLALGAVLDGSGGTATTVLSTAVLVVPSVLAGVVSVLAVRTPVRPPWYVGVVASLGAVLAATAVGVLTMSRAAAYVEAPVVGALVVPVLVTVAVALVAGVLRARRWSGTSGPQDGYTTPSASAAGA